MIFDIKKMLSTEELILKQIPAAGWPNIPTSKCLTIRFSRDQK